MIRLWLDVPYRFVVKPAYERAQHMVDCVIDRSGDIYHDPSAGLLLLRPSCLDRRSLGQLIPLTEIERREAHWRTAYRGLTDATRAPFVARVRPEGDSYIELLINIAIIAIEGAPRMKWVMRTIPSLLRDESFAIHITCPDDEYGRDDDYYALQWDRYGLAMDTRGTLSLWLYDRTDLGAPPKRLASWYSGVSAPIRNALTVAVVPAPPLGLLVLTLTSGGGNPYMHTRSSTTRQLVSSKLVPLRDYMENVGTDDSPVWSLARPSPLHVAINLAYSPIIALERVRYPATGYAIERPHPLPPINPQVPTVVPIVAYTHNQNAIATPLLEDGSAWTAPAAPNAYRTRVDLTASADGVYTPIVVGHYTRAEPLIAERATTPVQVQRITEIELTYDEYAREEGHVEIVDAQPLVQTILRRGDTTYLLELSSDGGNSWVAIGGGYARVEQLERMQALAGSYPYRAKLELRGMWSRFAEIYQMLDTAFDGVSLAEAYNKLLEGAGYERIPDSELPPQLQTIRLPSAASGDTGQGWRYAPRAGQSGEEIYRTLQLLALATGSEWRLRYDLLASPRRWRLEPKPDGLPAWTLHAAQRDYAQRIAPYNELAESPQPPEANLVWVEGATNVGKEGDRLVVQLVNLDSLDNPASPDYLGRIVVVRLQSDALDTIERVQGLADAVYRTAARQWTRFVVRVPLTVEQIPATRPLWGDLPRRVIIRDRHDAVLLEGYIKRATLTARVETTRQTCTLELAGETVYETDPRDR